MLEAVEEMRRIGLLIHVVSRTMRFEYDLDKEVVLKRGPGYADASYQGVNYLWIGLGVALIAFTVYSLWRAPSKKTSGRGSRMGLPALP